MEEAAPNPTGSRGIDECFKGKKIAPVLNVPGCPPNPLSMIGSIVHFLTKGAPEVDKLCRPKVFYGKTVPEQCERIEHYNNKRFAKSLDSE